MNSKDSSSGNGCVLIVFLFVCFIFCAIFPQQKINIKGNIVSKEVIPFYISVFPSYNNHQNYQVIVESSEKVENILLSWGDYKNIKIDNAYSFTCEVGGLFQVFNKICVIDINK